MRRTLLAAIVACAAISCTPRIRTDYYLINTAPAVSKAPAQLPLTVVINHVRAPSRYQDQINYRTSEYQIGFYEYSRWAEPPPEMVWRALYSALKDSGLFEKIDPSDIAWNPDLILQSAILNFDQVVEKDGEFAECALVMELLMRDTGKPVWAKQTAVRVKQEKRGMFVAAMSEAVAKAVTESIADMEESSALKELAAGKKK
jgi:ABC-type uncharacterized transport system auxiliary subunit